MDIRIGKYKLSSSSKGFTISEVKVKTDGSNPGTEYDTDKTYHPTLVSALDNVLNRKIKESEATTLKELLVDFQRARDELKALWGGLI